VVLGRAGEFDDLVGADALRIDRLEPGQRLATPGRLLAVATVRAEQVRRDARAEHFLSDGQGGQSEVVEVFALLRGMTRRVSVTRTSRGANSGQRDRNPSRLVRIWRVNSPVCPLAATAAARTHLAHSTPSRPWHAYRSAAGYQREGSGP
jgi:hypothetical protein